MTSKRVPGTSAITATMTATMTAALAALAALAPACGGDGGGGGGGAAGPFTVYTRNLYLGASLTSLASVPTPQAVPAEAARLWGDVQASDFPERAKVLAADIVAAAPDLVALQEVTLYRRQAPSDWSAAATTPNATEVAIDFLALLTAEIAARGATYHVAVEAPNADAELPVDDGAGGLFDLRVTDRDVMLVREGVTTSNPVVTPFQNAALLMVGGTGGVPIRFQRSTSRVSVQIDTEGPALTFANGHLEIGLLSGNQMAQAQETVQSLAGVTGPVVLAGDFNSPPGQLSYPILVPAFTDAGVALGVGTGGRDPQFTCCLNIPEVDSTVDERIDLVLLRGGVRAKSIVVRGHDPVAGRTPGGLWGSDHLGVLAGLEL